MRYIAALMMIILCAAGSGRAGQIGWQFTFRHGDFAQDKYAPTIAKNQAHYVLEHGYLSNIKHDFPAIDTAHHPFFGIRARNVKGGIFVKFRIDGQWQDRWVIAGWSPKYLRTRYVDLREYGEKVSGLWLNSRSSTDGAEWFLDWVGVVRDDNPLGVIVRNAGALTRLPEGRSVIVSLKNRLDTPVECWCAVRERDPPSREHGSAPFRLEQGQETRLQLPVPSDPGSRYELRVVDRQNAIVYHDSEQIVPKILDARMTVPCYRNAIYATQQLEAVELQCTASVGPPLQKDLTFTAVLTQNGERFQRVEKTTPDLVTALKLPIGDRLAVGDYEVDISLSLAKHRVAHARLPLNVYGPNANEIRVDENLNLLINGKPFLPFGLYSVPARYLEQAARTGLSAVLTYSRATQALSDYLDAAERVGLKAVVHSPALWFGKDGEAKLKEAVMTLRHHNALLGWYLIDEPNSGRKGASPDDLARLYALMRNLDPFHPTFTVYCRPAEFAAYRDTHDVFMCDPYPVGNRPLSFVAEWTDLAQDAMAGAKPVHIVPQSFGSEDGPQVHWRLPTAAEEICMGYLALVHGAKGLFYYRFDVQRHDKTLADQGRWPWRTIGYLPELRPETWAAFETLGPQLRRFGPVFLAPEPDATVTVTPLTPRIHAAPREHQAVRYLFVVNPHEQAIDARIEITGWDIERAQRLAQGSAGVGADPVPQRNIAVRGGAFADRLEALAVHIYRIE